jgi:hypothetical protein
LLILILFVKIIVGGVVITVFKMAKED